MKKNLFKKYPINFQEIAKYLFKAKQDLADALKILKISEEASFKTSYDAMIKISLALAMTYGLRPRSQAGHHLAMIEFAKKVLGPGHLPLIKKFDRMRKRRHLLVYQAEWISQREAKQAIKVAEQYLAIVVEVVQKKNPQKDLFQG